MPGKDLVPRPLAQPPAVPQAVPWAADKRETVTAWKWLYRRRHWTLPAFLLPASLAAGLLTHHFHVARYVFFGGILLSVMLALLGPSKWDRAAEVAYVVLSSLAATVWLTYAAVFGVVSLPVVISAAVLVAAWGAIWWRHKRPRGQRRRQKRVAKWDAWWQSHCWHWNLGGSKVADVHEMGVTTKVRVHGVPGRQSIQHVNQVMHLIESGLDGYTGIGLVRAEAVKAHPNWFDFYFKKENPLREPVEYDPALAPRSVHEPFALGRTETGNWKMLPLRCNRFTIGASRTGKSNDELTGLAALTGCPDSRQILIDLKGGRSARPVLAAAAVDYVITEQDEARALLRLLVAETMARAKYAYIDEEEQLHATAEIPALHLLIDEVHGLTSVANGDGECSRLLAEVASKGMGLEVYTWIYTQHGSLEESVRTEQTRGNLNVRTVYRVEEARHGSYVIPEYTRLDASKLEEQGTCYVKHGKDALPEQVRAPKMEHKLLKRIAAQNARMVLRPPLVLYCGGQDAGNGQTWQEWWDTRWSRLDKAFHGISPQYQRHATSSPAAAFAAQPPAPEPAPAPAPGEGTGAEAAARIAAELAGVPDAAPPKVNLGPMIRTQSERFAAALETAPPAGISPAQLMDESGRGSSWVHEKLKALVALGAVTQAGRGRYVPVPGADIAAALETIKNQNDRLYREARDMVSAA